MFSQHSLKNTNIQVEEPLWVFHDEGIAYAARLAAAGVPCDLDVVPGAFHGFDRFVPWARVSKRFVSNIQERLRLSLVLPDSTGAGT